MLCDKNTVSTALTRIAARALREPTATFENVWHVLTFEELADCFHTLRKDAAAGVDKVTYEDYASQLETNLQSLIARIKAFSYHPQPARRVYIEKADGGKRPLGIPSLEDKIVQEGMRRILHAIFESQFLECSHGFRPNRSCHTALQALEKKVVHGAINYVLDADITAYFDSIPHDKLLKCIRQRITDQRFLRYLVRFLRSGVMEEGEKLPVVDTGVMQGGLISPILSNIFLHYALDTWFTLQIQPTLRGQSFLNRYADDFVMGFQYEDDAKRIHEALQARLSKCGLTLSAMKTRLVLFSRFAYDRAARSRYPAGTFDYLGFTHYWQCKGAGQYSMYGRKTSRKRLVRRLRELRKWFHDIRSREPLAVIWKTLCAKLRGHANYYGIPYNGMSVKRYFELAKKLAFKWLNRRSQRRSWNWKAFTLYMKRYPLPKVPYRHEWPTRTAVTV